MGTLSLVQAKRLFTQSLQEIWSERVQVKLGLRSFATEKESNSKLISLETRRGTEKMAVDILPGSDVNMNKKSKSSLRIYQPPNFGEGFSHEELDYYDVVFGQSGDIDMPSFNALIDEIADQYEEIRAKIDRRLEYYMAQIFTSGQITLTNGDDIDFNRKLASIVTNGAGDKWDDPNSDIEQQLIDNGDFLRGVGKSNSVMINALLGDKAYIALKDNPKLSAKLDIRNIDQGLIKNSQMNAAGLVPKGMLDAGNYTYILWGYSEGYEDSDGNFNKYLPENAMWSFAEDMKINMSFAGIPKLQTTGMAGLPTILSRQGGYQQHNYIDEKATRHMFELRAAAVPVPVTIDKFTTRYVVD